MKFESLAFKLYPDGIIDRDVSHARLSAKGFEKSPRDFHFLQIAAPIFLLILTRLRMPVSTTFILLTSFAATPAAVGGVLAKSMSGYILSFLMGLFFFLIVYLLAPNGGRSKPPVGQRSRLPDLIWHLRINGFPMKMRTLWVD